jgi:hypothetical protein
MTMLTSTQRAALSSALEGAETGDGDATQSLFRALSDVLPFHTLNILTAARWLLWVDDAHRAAITAAEARVCRVVANRLRHNARAQGNTVARDALMNAAASVDKLYIDHTADDEITAAEARGAQRERARIAAEVPNFAGGLPMDKKGTSWFAGYASACEDIRDALAVQP